MNVKDAVFSDCGNYRYDLLRHEEGCRKSPYILWIMLNPSVADSEINDPTIRRIMSFSALWGFQRLHVVNLFAYKSTDPDHLRLRMLSGFDVVGPQNNDQIHYAASGADIVVCAWGGPRFAEKRAIEVRGMLQEIKTETLALSITKNGAPGHPLYIRGDTQLVPYTL